MAATPITLRSPAATDAATAFASALSATPEWREWEEAAMRLRADPSAQRASAAYDERRQALRIKLMLQAASAEEKADLERLERALFAQPSVAAYTKAEADLKALCRATADRLSRAIGLDYAASCATGCCG